MTSIKRGHGSRRGIHLCAVAALGLALSGCGSGGSSSGAAATAQSAQSSISGQSSTTTQDVPSAPGASTGSGTTAGSTSSGSTGANLPTPSANSVTINWMPPTENTDGSTLMNLAGYNIHYGTASHAYTQVVSVSNSGLATYVVSNLTPGTYYFAVAAVNSKGTESPLSSEVSATVN